LLSRNHWEGVSLVDLVHNVLAPCVREGNAKVDGPKVLLSSEAAQPIAIVLHELVTNASKHGALTTPQGRISVRWNWRRDVHVQGRLLLEWVETGGPRVVVPNQIGYGISAIRSLVPYELGGTVGLDFDADGLRCSIELPFQCIRSDSGSPNLILASDTAASLGS
jgi:two-component sensor histidine kinase